MKLNLKTELGNDPKKELLRDLTEWFVTYDLVKVKPFLADDVKWTLVGEEPIDGKEEFLSALVQMIDIKATDLTILSVCVDGEDASIHGEMTMENGDRFGFADFYQFDTNEFKTAKTIISYVIPLK